jgi:hypothetical protein
VTFEDTAIGVSGVFNFRFTIIAAPVPPANVPMSSVTITSTEITLPEANNDLIRQDIVIDSVINIVVDNILPVDATNKNYTVTLSNTRGTVVGNQVTFSVVGLISVYVTFEDTSVGVLGVFNFRFNIVAAPVPPADVPISSVTVTSSEITLPAVNNSLVRQNIVVGSVFTLIVEILPSNASNINYTIISSQTGRATVSGLTVTVIGTGSFSIKLTFEDTTVGVLGLLEYRFSGVTS